MISSNARAALNEAGGKNRLDHSERDVDWLAELARGPGQFVNSVYKAHVSPKLGHSTIKTKNSQDDTVFTLTNDHELKKHITTVPQWGNKVAKPQTPADSPIKKGRKNKQNQEEKAPSQKMMGDLEIEDVGGW